MTALQQRAARSAPSNTPTTIMPGFTHLQTAQPVTFGHHLLAYVEMFARDRDRLVDCRKRAEPPAARRGGAGRHQLSDRPRMHVAQTLGFDGLCANSLDAVSDRDFAHRIHGGRRASS